MTVGRGTVVRAILVTAACVAGGTAPAFALQTVRLWGGGSVAVVGAVSESSGEITDLSGTLLGVAGRAAVGPLALHVRYAEGDLDPANDDGVGQRHIEGVALLGVTPLAGLEVGGGPRVRSIVRDERTQRWVVWQVGGRYESPALAPWVRGVVQGWIAVGGDVSNGGEFTSGRGGAAGILVRPGDGPLEIRVDYTIDELRLGEDAGRETMEGFTLTVGWGRQ
jgi:hypothetical protein